jgi:hypothetical protein
MPFYFMVQWQQLRDILPPRQGDDRDEDGGAVMEQVDMVCFVFVCACFKEGRGDGGCAVASSTLHNYLFLK